MVSINVTVAMPPEMLDAIDEQKPETKSRAQFIRDCIRDDVDLQLRTQDHEQLASTIGDQNGGTA